MKKTILLMAILLFVGNDYPGAVADYDNNFIFSDGSKIVIYNPDGVVGYEKARGKIIKL